jgi:hypothetical protein
MVLRHRRIGWINRILALFPENKIAFQSAQINEGWREKQFLHWIAIHLPTWEGHAIGKRGKRMKKVRFYVFATKNGGND